MVNNSQDNRKPRRNKKYSFSKKNQNRKPKNAKSKNSKPLKPIDAYLEARSKYYESYREFKTKRIEKLERNYISQLKAFYKTLTNAEQQENKEKGVYKIDSLISANPSHQEHSFQVSAIEKINDHIKEFHGLNIQKSVQYSEDKEESNGTFEEYESYKNQREALA